jgi:hypothetical protein
VKAACRVVLLFILQSVQNKVALQSITLSIDMLLYTATDAVIHLFAEY